MIAIISIICTMTGILLAIYYANKQKINEYYLRKRVFVGDGFGYADSPYLAGKQAAQEAKKKCGGKPTFGLVFVSAKYEDIEKVVKGINEEFKGVPWIGCTSYKEINKSGVLDKSVVCIALRSSFISVGVGIGENIRSAPTESGEISILKALLDVEKKSKKNKQWPYKTLIMFPSGIISTKDKPCVEQDIINGILKYINDEWIVVGGSAAGISLNDDNWQFINGRVYENAVVCAVIYSKVRIKVAVGLGYKETGDKVKATKTVQNIIHELNDNQACNEFAKLTKTDLLKNDLLKVVIKYSLAIIDSDDQFCWCVPPIYIRKDGGIVVTRKIDEGTYLAIVKSNKELLKKGCEDAVEKAIDGIDQRDIVAFLLFPCMLYRFGLSNEECDNSIREISSFIGENIPLAGFYTFGEQGRNKSGKFGQLNQSVAALVITREF